MIYAKKIDIREYPSNIEVFADFGEGRENYNGRVFAVTVDADNIPSASFVPTISQILEDANQDGDTHGITRAQAKEIKEAIYFHCAFIQNWY